MHLILHSPFLQALGYAIINSLWQFAILWLVYFFINSTFKLSSRQKYGAGLVFEFAGFAWFLATLFFYYNQYSILVSEVVAKSPVILPSLSSIASTSLKQQFFLLIIKFEQFIPYLSIAYLTLLLVLLLRWLRAFKYSNSVRTKGILEIEEKWQNFVKGLATHLGIKQEVQIFLSEVVQTPLTVGFLKPLILIPIATINYLNTEQIEAVILHELAHIRRFDYLFNLVLAVIEACLFYNPFMLLLQQQIRRERENCCDDWVLNYNYCASSYTKALLQIASSQIASPVLAIKATGDKRLLISRVKRMIEKKELSFFNYRYQLLALLSITCLFIILSLLSPYKKELFILNLSSSRKIVFEPIAAKVNNPFFNPVFFLADKGNAKIIKKRKTNLKTSVQNGMDTHMSAVSETIIENENDEPEVIDENEAVQARLNAGLEKTTLLPEDENNINELETLLLKKIALPKLQEKERIKSTIQRDHEKKEFFEAPLSPLKVERLKFALRDAIAQLNSNQKEAEINRLKKLINISINRITKADGNFHPFDRCTNDVERMNIIVHAIEEMEDSCDQSVFYTTGLNDDINFATPLPPFAYTISRSEKDHLFSYQYSLKPRIKIIHAPGRNGTEGLGLQRTKEEVIVDGNNDESLPTINVAPSPSNSKIFLRIVKI